ncbi:MAG TPA: lysylphosphatidylglycerol synthase transmembrane domain-containing protein [Thermomicrobiales bacterium]|nr:lysylphosphatidylglycerol synthase transmembrane domain-containing protein [Thermomicrobiales bacterium]
MSLADGNPERDAPTRPKARGAGQGFLGAIARTPTPLIFISCVILAILLLWWQGQVHEIISIVARARLQPLLIAAPIYVVSLWLLCLRWHLLVRMAQGWSDFPRASEAFLTSVVINYAAPIGLAVPSRAALTKRALGLDHGTTGTIALWEIGADVLVLGAGSVLWLFLAEGSTSAVGSELSASAGQYARWGGVAIVLVLLTLAWSLRSPGRRRRFLGLAQKILVAPSVRPIEALMSIGVTLVYWMIQGVVLALLVHAMRVDISFEFILGLTSVPILVGMLSPIPGGAVVREALMYVVARLADVPAGEVVAAAVIYRIALFGAIPILYALTRWWISRRVHHQSNPSRHEPVGTA